MPDAIPDAIPDATFMDIDNAVCWLSADLPARVFSAVLNIVLEIVVCDQCATDLIKLHKGLQLQSSFIDVLNAAVLHEYTLLMSCT